ncbi:MAG TPA: hypothetical protein VF062_24895 [Candidatus Limnocylindrales bacterium]
MTLTGQDIGEAQGALSALFEGVLQPHGMTGNEFIAMRVIVTRGGELSPEGMRDFLASQRQLHLDRAGTDALFGSLEAKGLVRNGSLTGHGEQEFARISRSVGGLTSRLFTGFDAGELTVAHDVLRRVIDRAGVLRGELSAGDGLAVHAVVQDEEG